MVAPSSEVGAVTPPPPAPVARRRPRGRGGGLRTVFDFFCVELLTSLRLPMSLRLFQVLAVGCYVVGTLVALAVSLVVFSLSHALTRDEDGAGYAITAMVCVATGYLGGAYIFREAFSRRRFIVSNSPNVALFRALDVRAADVLAVYCGLRVTAFYLALLLVDLSFVLVFGSSLDLPAWGVPAVLLLPLAMYLVTLAVAANSADRRTRPEPMRQWTVLALGTVCFVAGFGTARYLLGPVRSAGLATSFGAGQVTVLLAILGVGSAVVGAAAAVRLIVSVRRVLRDPFSIQEVRPTTAGALPAGARTGRLARALPLPGILHRELVMSWSYPLLKKAFALLLMILLVGLGVLVSGASVLPVADVPDRAVVIFHATVFTVLMGATELILKVIGPTTLATQFRFAWEQHLSEWRIARSAVAYYLGPVALFGAGSAALLSVVTGTVSAGPVSVGVAVMSAAVFAESVLAVPKNVDGSSANSTVAALATLMLAAPVLLALSAHSALGEILAAAYAACLLGGAVACMGRRIRTLPSTSGT
jgi:hypothetical protein